MCVSVADSTIRSKDIGLYELRDLLDLCSLLYIPKTSLLVELKLPRYWEVRNMGNVRISSSPADIPHHLRTNLLRFNRNGSGSRRQAISAASPWRHAPPSFFAPLRQSHPRRPPRTATPAPQHHPRLHQKPRRERKAAAATIGIPASTAKCFLPYPRSPSRNGLVRSRTTTTTATPMSTSPTPNDAPRRRLPQQRARKRNTATPKKEEEQEGVARRQEGRAPRICPS